MKMICLFASLVLVVACQATGPVLLGTQRLDAARAAPADTSLGRLRADLLAHADAIVARATTYSVTFNEFVPEGATRHDYASMGPYWWPDPDQPDGLPYIRRDGRVNPERDKVSDLKPLQSMVSDVTDLALAHALCGDEAYAAFAVTLLRVWFIDPETRMHPHLLYAQGIPGLSTGRPTGIIDAAGFAELVDAICLLQQSASLDASTRAALAAWFTTYHDWLVQHPNAILESQTANNHATAYDVQAVAIGLFLGRRDWARRHLLERTLPRLGQQIRSDGSQPLELERTKSWNYSCGNLTHFFHLGVMGLPLGVDLFSHREDGIVLMRAALDFLLPYADRLQQWPYQSIVEWQPGRLRPVLAIAASAYHDPRYQAELKRLGWEQLPLEEFLVFPDDLPGPAGEETH